MQREPTGSVILRLYEAGMTCGPIDRAILLCERAGKVVDQATIGDVDRAVWGWMADVFDGPFESVAACVNCSADLEFHLPAEFAPAHRSGDGDVRVSFKGKKFQVRLPTLLDLGEGQLDRRKLCPDAPWEDADFIAATEAEMEVADPGLRTILTLSCDACGNTQSQLLDAVGYTWSKVEQAARQLIQEVALLAKAYGWRESDITSMTSTRRALYLAELGE